ncbi:formyl transferase [Candidatus Nitrotoga arctica]|uniref:phosphoribosylglycinamide formyltransferase 1 n=1 Tax=Candidatus Nitrotoga arctica TaxID=453162 RepID=A0ABM8Z103_9PROT|nr:formyl transferase [Candidatus Nitrotoga arctica]CAG9933539.1 Formyl_trans_N domain-containing protein [Candidatus Nitrotoga arctica]
MAELSIMVLCGRAPRHLYVANRLCSTARVVAIVQEAGSHWTYKKILKLLRPDNLWRKVWRWLRDRKRYADGGEGKFFFGGAEPQLDRPELITEVPHINHPSVIELADRLRPDVIAVFGTSLIKGALLKRGSLGIVNLHGGLSPEYRGADCTFWALYNGEPEKIGCTLHFIDSGIDTGKLLAHICPEVHEGDNELTLFWRAVRDSAEVYAEVIGRLARNEALGAPQSGKGKLYQVKDRGWHHEQHLAQGLHNGLLKDIHLKKRVIWFTPTSSEKEQR